MNYWSNCIYNFKSNPIKKLILFDIDGTLVFTSRLHRDSFKFALQEVYHINAEMPENEYHGWTDRPIMRDLALKAGISRLEVEEKLDQAMACLENQYFKVHELEKGIILPGIPSLLENLIQNGYLCGLVTGNMESIAYYKLKAYGLTKYFALGGFGSDAEDRWKLLLLAIDRAKIQFNFVQNPKNVVYVADTPKDVYAANMAKLPCIIIYNTLNREYSFENLQPSLFLTDANHHDAFFNFIEDLDRI